MKWFWRLRRQKGNAFKVTALLWHLLCKLVVLNVFSHNLKPHKSISSLCIALHKKDWGIVPSVSLSTISINIHFKMGSSMVTKPDPPPNKKEFCDSIPILPTSFIWLIFRHFPEKPLIFQTGISHCIFASIQNVINCQGCSFRAQSPDFALGHTLTHVHTQTNKPLFPLFNPKRKNVISCLYPFYGQ